MKKTVALLMAMLLAFCFLVMGTGCFGRNTGFTAPGPAGDPGSEGLARDPAQSAGGPDGEPFAGITPEEGMEFNDFFWAVKNA